ncbi:hypothetical protein OJAV_G00069190 [Oryzias javanicus]|uniref:Uncharacterized protein n=1 Tax=Oryzias javanicus TaxID=123683 RepID=A0A437D6K0_ORYJA|nr:hypothetical protein OJAV_G00069190 [Oryzias javanicus]
MGSGLGNLKVPFLPVTPVLPYESVRGRTVLACFQVNLTFIPKGCRPAVGDVRRGRLRGRDRAGDGNMTAE